MNKKILIYRYNSICEPFVIRALQSLGVIVDEVTEAMTNKNMSAKEEMLLISNRLAGNHYDAVYSINFYPVISEVCRIYKVPYICQTVDCPVFE